MRRLMATVFSIGLVGISFGQAAKPNAVKSKQVAKAPAPEPEVVDFTPAKKPASPGPFGFEAGMTKDQVIAKLGPSSVKKVGQYGVVSFSTAPIPHPDFTDYHLRFDDDGKLIQIIAFTDPISSNDRGDQVKDKYEEISKALHAKYGLALDVDMLNDGSMWHEPQYWMMGLLKKDRKLESLWGASDHDKLPHGLAGIMLEAEALNSSTAVITLTYEFQGFAQWADKKKSTRDSAF
jgi:hypothetical protein